MDNILHLQDRNDWRDWLSKHYDSEKEAWLVYPKKSTGKKRILYNDAVEVALCFGWIDSIVRSLDSEHSMQRFTPRRSGKFSQPNKERIRYLAKKGLLLPKIAESMKAILEEEFQFPQDIIEMIRKDDEAWQHYVKLPMPYRRIRIAYINAARKRPEEFTKRLAHFIKITGTGRMIKGYGGVDKYYEE